MTGAFRRTRTGQYGNSVVRFAGRRSRAVCTMVRTGGGTRRSRPTDHVGSLCGSFPIPIRQKGGGQPPPFLPHPCAHGIRVRLLRLGHGPHRLPACPVRPVRLVRGICPVYPAVIGRGHVPAVLRDLPLCVVHHLRYAVAARRQARRQQKRQNHGYRLFHRKFLLVVNLVSPDLVCAVFSPLTMQIHSSCGDFVQTTPNFFEKITVDSFAGKQYNDIAEQKR